ncbi:MAG: type II secretion system protein [Clostridia bacterium]|nr:type II secretion system protein [Clostridia bacterium]
MKKTNKKGFTLVELVIVIAVIAILAAVMIPAFTTIVDKAQESKALQEVKAAYNIQLAVDLSTSDTGDDVVYGEDSIVVLASNGKYVTITDDSITVAASGTATHTLVEAGGLAVAA